jgi:NAD(P)-dependent dehydrogenase (short-subunit alcohol dehydrogenase family)
LVTGSSRGLGKAIAEEMGKAGQKVVVNYVSDSSHAQAEATVAAVKANGGDAMAVKADSTLLVVTPHDMMTLHTMMFIDFKTFNGRRMRHHK